MKLKHILYIYILIFLITILTILSQINYLVVHTFIEVFGGVVAITIFCIGWNTRKYSKNNFIFILAFGYLLVGILSLFHTLTFGGFGVINDNSNITSQFWIATRYIESLTILFAVLFFKIKKLPDENIILLIILTIGSVITLSIFLGYFPDGILVESGLTNFLIISEILICLILFISGMLMWKQRKLFEKEIVIYILMALVFSILAELSFTLYMEPYGFFNVLGHILMFISLICIYIAIVTSSLTKPYRTLFNNITSYANRLRQKNAELIIKDKALESSLNGIALCDLNGCITYVNSAFKKMMGYEDNKDLNGIVYTVFFKNQNAINKIKTALATENYWSGEILAHNVKNEKIELLLLANYVFIDNQPRSIMVSFLDITEQKRVEKQLIQAKKDAEKANVAKSTFLANMSHEIRTPMNGILGYLHLLEETKVTQKQQEFIQNIKTSSDLLLNIINDVLDVSKIEAGRMELEMVPFDLHQEVQNALIPFANKAKEKGIKLILDIQEYVTRNVIGDPTRLKQIISNLVNNSIKFTEEGYVRVGVMYVSEKESLSRVEIKVTDTGIGIPNDMIKNIYKPFIQADISSTRKYGGTGLGLTICKSILDLMGGKISIESEEGKGTCVSFLIDLRLNSKPEPQVELKSLCPSLEFVNAKDLNVLLVEDNEINRDLLLVMMKTNGINCDVAENGKKAVTACMGKNYDIILMDCQMPIMDGFEATKRIRNLKKNNRPAIIAITADAMKSDVEKCLKVGMDDFISKPINFTRLLTIIEKYTLVKD